MKLSQTGRKGIMVLVWLGAASALMVRSISFFDVVEESSSLALWIAVGAVIGGGKGWFVLSKSVRRNMSFIDRRPEKDWIWMSLHPVLYILIPVMIGMGMTLRHFYGESNPGLVGAVYLGISLALAIGLRGLKPAN